MCNLRVPIAQSYSCDACSRLQCTYSVYSRVKVGLKYKPDFNLQDIADK